MRRCAALLVVALLAFPAVAQAQSGYLWAGVGPSIPIGDAGDAFEMGWLGTAGVGLNISSVKGLSLQGEGLFGSHSWKVGSGRTSMMGAIANLALDLKPGQKVNPYIYGGAGILSMKAEGGDSESEGAFQVGGGLSFILKPKLSLWVDLRYLSSGSGSSKMTIMPIVAGLSWLWGTTP